MDLENSNETLDNLEQENENKNSARNGRDKNRSSLVILQSAFHHLSADMIPVVEEDSDHNADQEVESLTTIDEINSENLDRESYSKRKSQTKCRDRHRHLGHYIRSLRQIIFLLLADPQSSIFSALFFFILIAMISLSNLLMMMQTTDRFTYTPTSCLYCTDLTDIHCKCPPKPLPSLMRFQDYIIMFFTAEWVLRVLCFTPKICSTKQSCLHKLADFFKQWLSFLCQPSTIIDFLAIFPYYLERFGDFKGLLALRLLRLFRVFHLLRLGKYNVTFKTLSNVMTKSFLGLNILFVVLFFGAAFFGSMIYWFEKGEDQLKTQLMIVGLNILCNLKGEWRYDAVSESYRYMRLGADGVSEEPSPFSSIPAAFWWFIVTATTVGYGGM